MEAGNDPFEFNRKLKEALGNIPVKFSTQLRRELCNECGWTYATLNTRMNSVRAIKKPEIPVIKRIFEKYGIDVF
jgi:hypothetical protein